MERRDVMDDYSGPNANEVCRQRTNDRVMHEKAAVIGEQSRAEKLRIYKVRLSTDDGWYFYTARNRREAEMGYKSESVFIATADEIRLIATRALM